MDISHNFQRFLYDERAKREQDQVTLDEFFILCKRRLKMLQEVDSKFSLSLQDIDQTKLKDQIDNSLQIRTQHEIITQINEKGGYIKESLGHQKAIRDELLKDYNNDNISHYLLRLCYCRTKDLRDWFAKQEGRVLKARLSNCFDLKPYQSILNEQNYLQNDEFDLKKQKIMDSSLRDYNLKDKDKQDIQFSRSDFFKFKFQEVYDLVEKNRCYLEKGMAYVFKDDLKVVLINQFKKRLIRDLELMQNNIENVIKDKRLQQFIINLPDQYLGHDYNPSDNTKKGKINLQDIDMLSKRSMPPCMKYLLENLKINSHLKHYGRMQLGLFLKGAGLEFQDSVLFWKKAFSKKIGGDEFDKDYLYNIKHNYGKEGKKTDYTPMSCNTILQKNPSTGEYHGCPFKTLDSNHLAKFLETYNIQKREISEIIEKKIGYHHQVACRLTFKHSHPDASNDLVSSVGQHPNSFFEASLKFVNLNKVNEENEKMEVEK